MIYWVLPSTESLRVDPSGWSSRLTAVSCMAGPKNGGNLMQVGKGKQDYEDIQRLLRGDAGVEHLQLLLHGHDERWL